MKRISYFADFVHPKSSKYPMPKHLLFLFFYFLFFISYFFHFFIFYIFFFECLDIPFFSSLTCDLWDTMPPQRSLTLLPREAEDFPSGGNHFRYIPPLTYLAWLQPIYYNSRFIFIHINITKAFTCGENFDKKNSFFSRFSFWK